MPSVEIVVSILSAGIAAAALSYARQSAHASKESSRASRKSACAAEAANQLQLKRFELENSARLVLVDRLTGLVQEGSDEETLLFQCAFRNEGAVSALEPMAGLFCHQTGFDTGLVSANGSFDEIAERTDAIRWPLKMPGGAVWLFQIYVERNKFGSQDPRMVSILAKWRDALRSHESRNAMVYYGDLSGRFGGAAPAEVVIDGKVIIPRGSMLEEEVLVHPHHEYVPPKVHGAIQEKRRPENSS